MEPAPAEPSSGSGAPSKAVTLTSNAYTTESDDLNFFLDVTPGASDATVTLIAAATAGNGAVQLIRKLGVAAGRVIVSDGANVLGNLYVRGDWAAFRSDGSAWSAINWQIAPVRQVFTASGTFFVDPLARFVDVELLAAYVRRLRTLEILRIIFENPVGHMSAVLGKPSQILQPYEHGDDASKKTCIWEFIDGRLSCGPIIAVDPTKRVTGRFVFDKNLGRIVERWSNQTDQGQNRLTDHEDRWKDRSRTFPGIGDVLSSALTAPILV